jgi:RimJ/RimL family protein N-acetyltransferase
MGFWIGMDWWGKGYATEAAYAVIRHGFAGLKLNRIYAHHMVRNLVSGRAHWVLQGKAGAILPQLVDLTFGE